jgi:hypothetical protein
MPKRAKLSDLLTNPTPPQDDDSRQQPEPIKEPQPNPEPIEAPPKPKDEPPQESPKLGRPKEPNSRTARLERGEFKQVKAIISAELHKRVKLAAVMGDQEISSIIEEALEEWLRQRE